MVIHLTTVVENHFHSLDYFYLICRVPIFVFAL